MFFFYFYTENNAKLKNVTHRRRIYNKHYMASDDEVMYIFTKFEIHTYPSFSLNTCSFFKKKEKTNLNNFFSFTNIVIILNYFLYSSYLQHKLEHICDFTLTINFISLNECVNKINL